MPLEVNAANIKRWLLPGVDTTDDDGTDYLSDVMELGIPAGLAYLQTALGDLPIVETAITEEMHDLEPGMAANWQLLQLDKRPVKRGSVNITLMYGDQEVFTYDQRWIRTLVPEAGQIQVMPVVGKINAFSAQFSGLLPTMGSAGNVVPGWFKVSYTAGWDAASMPVDILNAWAMAASMYVLNPAGDLIVGAGIASESINIDQMGQSVNTTSSATNAGYGSRIIQYRKDIDAMLPDMILKYNGIGIEFG